jgi:hypothetical protein
MFAPFQSFLPAKSILLVLTPAPKTATTPATLRPRMEFMEVLLLTGTEACVKSGPDVEDTYYETKNIVRFEFDHRFARARLWFASG